MKKYKALNQSGSNREIIPVRKKGKKEENLFTISKKKKEDKSRDVLKDSTKKKCTSTTLKILKLHRLYNMIRKIIP